MGVLSKSVIGRVTPQLERFINLHILGLRPDPDTWPEPHNVDCLAIPEGLDRSNTHGPAWILTREHTASWHHRRTMIGMHAYRLAETEDYDCGWRLVDVAYRFLAAHLGERTIDLVTIIPPPPVYARVAVLEWSAERLAKRLGARYVPTLFEPAAPIGKHPDLVDRLPVIPVEFYSIAEPITFRDKTVLLADWRWHEGRMMTILARRLVRAGAEVVRFAWLA
ncbi:MAG TPA: phosphoribosyltransferase [Acidobacteriota bacterium]|nr:phosphoribosyltransferase [Acidobacteriota bacterium]